MVVDLCIERENNIRTHIIYVILLYKYVLKLYSENKSETSSLQTEVTALQHALPGVVVCHQLQFVDAAGRHSTTVHERRLPMIMGIMQILITFFVFLR
jgi:hypothetical protein